MRYFLLIVLIVVIFSCKKTTHPIISIPIEKYKPISKSIAAEKLGKAYNKSKDEFVMDFDSGDFYGVFDGIKFVGKYDIIKVRSGVSKGFNYEVELAFLSKDYSEKTIDYFDSLITCTRIFVSPDNLNEPKKMTLKIGDKNKSDKLELTMVL